MPPSSVAPSWKPLSPERAARLNDTPVMRQLGHTGGWREALVRMGGRLVSVCEPVPERRA